jgi:Arc/MetJ-type ribon-helix-helix transcriptional regulator
MNRGIAHTPVRIGVRVSNDLKADIETAVSDGRAKTLSDFIREAILEKLQRDDLYGQVPE